MDIWDRYKDLPWARSSSVRDLIHLEFWEYSVVVTKYRNIHIAHPNPERGYVGKLGDPEAAQVLNYALAWWESVKETKEKPSE